VTAGSNSAPDGWHRAQRRVDTLSDIAAEIRHERWSAPARAEPEIWLEPEPRPAQPRESSPPLGSPDDSVGDVIADFLRDAEQGRTRDSSGGTYTRESLRELRSSLSHIDAKLGLLSLGAIDSQDVDGLLADLHSMGLSRARLDAIVVALRALRAYAGDRGPTDRRPLPDPTLGEPMSAQRPYTPPAYAQPAFGEAAPDEPQAKASPTLELLATARRVATWTVRTTVFLFAVLVVLLILEL
jgi:hypothetical protein